MEFKNHSIRITTKERFEIVDITREVRSFVRESKTINGILNLWTGHTTACISINERDSSLWKDILSKMKTLVPPEGSYMHGHNAHAHIMSTLIKPGLSVPILNGDLELGTWQSILFIELDGPRTRKISVTTLGQ
jgi:secondary thiamine-phosphate synthase enzyme